MTQGSCHCGAVRFELKRPPEYASDCNCSICRRYGVLWAYYPTEDVAFTAAEDATEPYSWGKERLAFHRCKGCGCVTHWAATSDDMRVRLAVNARLLEPEVLAATRIRRFDGASSWKYLDD